MIRKRDSTTYYQWFKQNTRIMELPLHYFIPNNYKYCSFIQPHLWPFDYVRWEKLPMSFANLITYLKYVIPAAPKRAKNNIVKIPALHICLEIGYSFILFKTRTFVLEALDHVIYFLQMPWHPDTMPMYSFTYSNQTLPWFVPFPPCIFPTKLVLKNIGLL